MQKNRMKTIGWTIFTIFIVLSLSGCGGGGGGGGEGITPEIVTPLTDAKWSLEPGIPTAITWVNRNGETVQSEAVSGQVQIIVDPATMSQESVEQLVTQNGGTIFARLPALGLYWAKVGNGNETTFIYAIRVSVEDVFPNILVASRESTSLTIPTNWSDEPGHTKPLQHLTTGNLILDEGFKMIKPSCVANCPAIDPIYFTNPMCWENCASDPSYDPNSSSLYIENGYWPLYIKKYNGSLAVDVQGKLILTDNLSEAASHGDICDHYRTNGGKLTSITPYNSRVDADVYEIKANYAGDSDLLAIASMIDRAGDLAVPVTINYSRGPGEYYSGDIAGWEGYNQTNNSVFIDSLAAILEGNVRGASDAIIVQAAGNSGTDLTRAMVNLHTFHPEAAERIVEAGALTCVSENETYPNCTNLTIANHNFSTAEGTMIFVPLRDVTTGDIRILNCESVESPQGECLIDGTSYTAPQIAYLVWQIRTNRPDLTLAEVRQVLFERRVTSRQSVQLPDGRTIEIPVIENPYDPDVLNTALNVADELFPPLTTYTLTITKAGTGNGTVSTDKPCCTYDAETVVTLTVTPDAGSTFTGWSGACSGTESCDVTMDADKAVTATFRSAVGGGETFVTINSYSCTSVQSPLNQYVSTVTMTASGTAGGTNSLRSHPSLGTFFYITSGNGINPSVDIENCGNWTYRSGQRDCIRGPQDPETTTWSGSQTIDLPTFLITMGHVVNLLPIVNIGTGDYDELVEYSVNVQCQ